MVLAQGLLEFIGDGSAKIKATAEVHKDAEGHQLANLARKTPCRQLAVLPQIRVNARQGMRWSTPSGDAFLARRAPTLQHLGEVFHANFVGLANTQALRAALHAPSVRRLPTA